MIDDLTVTPCTPFIFKSHKTAVPVTGQNFFTDARTELGALFYPEAHTARFKSTVKFMSTLLLNHCFISIAKLLVFYVFLILFDSYIYTK